MSDKNQPKKGLWIGQGKELRKSYRRQTLAEVKFDDPLLKNSLPVVENLSLEGAFIQNNVLPPVGTDVSMNISIPLDRKQTIKLGGRVVRVTKNGFGIEFKELHSKDRSLIRQYVGFSELDDAIVTIQKTLKGILSGNMLPVTEQSVIEERINAAVDKNLECYILTAKKGRPFLAKLRFSHRGLMLVPEKPIPRSTRILYITIVDGPLHAIFEGLVYQGGEQPEIFFPERMYLNDRRWSRRYRVEKAKLVLQAYHKEDKQLEFSVYDRSESGCSILVPKNSLYANGMRFPEFEIEKDGNREHFSGATITRIIDFDNQHNLVGLHFIDQTQNRETFQKIETKSLRTNFLNSIRRLSTMAIRTIERRVRPQLERRTDRPYFVRYKNTRGEMVAALLDATFDLHSDPPPVDVAVIISPPFPVRKEVFGLLARTLVDNFAHHGKQAVVLRFDLTHVLGESEVDPELAAQGNPYLYWTFSKLEADIAGSVSFLQRRYTPKKRSLISYSISAISSRRLVADGYTAKIDHWVAPFGCPDGQDMLKNLLAGVDLFPMHLAGEKAEPFLIYGRLYDPNPGMADAVAKKTAFLEDARKDMEKIKVPVTWVIGTYDYMVTRGRVKEMLSAPGGGIREIIETSTGHNPRTGAEAIESFKIMFESMFKHLFGETKIGVEPNLVRFERQNQAEWSRSKKNTYRDMQKFWREHLVGTKDDQEGYDILLYNPDYVGFIKDQAKLIDIEPGIRVADFGCGTGNFSATMLKQSDKSLKGMNLVCTDLIPAGIDITRKKIEKIINSSNNGKFEGIQTDFQLLDLEVIRLSVLKDFLNGRLFSVKGLIGRIEGLNASTINRIHRHYNQDLHDILQGQLSDFKQITELCPGIEKEEVEELLDVSMACRFLKGETLDTDLIDPSKPPASTADLDLKHLNFGSSIPECRIDFDNNYFDRIGASLVVPYLYDPGSVVKEFYRMLNKNGVLVFSSLKPNYDSSKSYLEEAKSIAANENMDDFEKERLLKSLREFSAFVGRLIELEDEGRFKFFTREELIQITEKAGFENYDIIESLGQPSSAFIVRAVKT
jgi:ubiquinone/menaquinone biosynthesis C-methylase UbiE/pimeloyl-ACP methyl ester carboxylesterase